MTLSAINKNKKKMYKIIQWFETASPGYFLLGLIGAAFFLRLLLSIIFDRNDD